MLTRNQYGIVVLFLTVLCLIGGKPNIDINLDTMSLQVKECADYLFEQSKEDVGDKIKQMCLELTQSAAGPEITKEDMNYIRSLMREIVRDGHRHKRHMIRPGLHRRWIRKEVRRMSRVEWNNLVEAVKSLKRKGLYDKIAAIHRGARIDKAHFGPAFLGWHRLYLLIFEHALRREVRDVTIPYWDYSLDYDMMDPRKSILWTEHFFGNGNGIVNSGPFAWRTGQGDALMRNTGAAGTLVSKDFIHKVLSRISHAQIMDENSTDYWMEGYHNDVHVWVDGHLSILDSAVEDPVFWFHHAFIDYWWQLFMNKQIRQYHIYGIYPYNDYPDVRGHHNAFNLMDPFNITNRAGYLQHWYNSYYQYQRSPTCNRYWPYCGSQYLRCNVTSYRCVSIEGNINTENWDSHQGLVQETLAAQVGTSRLAHTDGIRQVVETPLLRAGRRFSSTKTDPRTVGRKQLQQRFSFGDVALISENSLTPVQPRGINLNTLNANVPFI